VQRREFLKLSATGVAGALLGNLAGCSQSGGSSGGAAAPTSTVVSATSPAATAPLANPQVFPGAPALLNQTPASIVRGCQQELDLDLNVISGALPTDIEGHALFIAARPYQDGTAIFNGDGLIHRVSLEGGVAKLKARFAKTPCYYADEATRGTSDGFTNPNKGLIRMSQTLGVRNEANTALVPMGPGRLLACYDGGRPYEVDPVTLDVVTAVGAIDEWEDALDFPALISSFTPGEVFPTHLSTAHPSYDPRTGELFTVNYSNQRLSVLGLPILQKTFTDIIRWDGQGQLERFPLLDDQGQVLRLDMSAHQIQATRDYIVLMDSAFVIEPERLFLANAFRAQESQATLWIVDRSQLTSARSGQATQARKVVIPHEAVHFVAAYESPAGLLDIVLQHNETSDGSESLTTADVRYDNGQAVRPELAGAFHGSCDLTSVSHHRIDAAAGALVPGSSRRLVDDDYTWTIGFAAHRGATPPAQLDQLYFHSLGFQADVVTERVAKHYESHPSRNRSISSLPFGTGRPGSVFRYDAATSSVADGYLLPTGRVPSSPVFMPRKGGSGDTDGYLFTTIISDDKSWPGSSGDEVWLFDAQNLAQGPICRLGHPQLEMCFTLHTTWLEKLESRSAPYRVDVEAEHQAEVAKLSPALQDMFKRDIYPNF
jgi:carotenoid cleavage dioxygenase-like enzyme